MRFLLPLTLLMLLASPGLATTQPAQMRVVLPYIPMLAETGGDGLFIDMFKQIAERADMTVSVEVEPVKRAMQSFANGEYDVMGAFPSLAEIPISLASTPFYLRQTLIFYRTERFAPGEIQNLADLDDMEVGLSAYEYPDYIMDRTAIRFERVPNDMFLMRMLEFDRLDAAIIERFSGRYLQNRLGMEQTLSAAKTAITTENVFALFKADLAGIDNRKRFNLALYDMLCDGSLAKLFGSVSLLPAPKLVERDLPQSAIKTDCNPQPADQSP